MYGQQQIETPLYSFNNIILKIVRDFEKEFNISNLSECIIFNNDSMSLFGWVNIFNHNGIIKLQINKDLDSRDFTIVNLIYSKYEFVVRQFSIYLMMYNRIAKECDEVPFQLVENVINDVTSKKFHDKKYLLPFKDKLSELDKELNIYNKYELFLSFHKTTYPNILNVRVKKYMSSDLDESVSINNLKYLDVDTIFEKHVNMVDMTTFIKNLYFYGKI